MITDQKKQEIGENMIDERKSAQLALSIETRNPKVEMLLLATEQGGCNQQHKFYFKNAADINVKLPAGNRYIIQVVAHEHKPMAFLASLEAGGTVRKKVMLLPEIKSELPGFKERLQAYGLKPEQAVEKLELKEHEARIAKNKEQLGVIRLKAKSLQDVKRFIGSPFGVFPENFTKYDPVKVNKEMIGRYAKKQKLSLEDHGVLKSLAHEYMYGNETAYASVIEELSSVYQGLILGDFYFHLFRELTIPAGSSYTFGPGTLILDRLRIHTTGKLIPKGQCKIDIGEWIEYS